MYVKRAGDRHDQREVDEAVADPQSQAVPIRQVRAVVHVDQNHEDRDGLKDHLQLAAEGGAERDAAALGDARANSSRAVRARAG
jgi:hypothetical protein